MSKIKYKSQETNYSCGASSLRNILIHYGIKLTEKYLRRLCNTSRDGTYEEDLVQAAEHFSFDTKTTTTVSEERFKKEISKGLRSGSVFLVLTEFESHWIAVVEMKNKRVKIIDSALDNPVLLWTLGQLATVSLNYEKDKNRKYYHFIKLTLRSE